MKKYGFLLVSLGTIGITTFFSLLPLAGKSQADISELYPTSFTPAGFTFSLWSIIYLSWIISGIISIYKNYIPSSYFLWAIALTALWLIPWHFQFIGTSVLVMWIILWLLLKSFFQESHPRSIKYSLELTLWWILIAMIANIHVFLFAYKLYFVPEILTCFSLFLAMGIQGYFISVQKSYVWAFVAIWACIWIISAQENILIRSSAEIVITTLFILLLLSFFWKKKLI